MKRQLRDVLVKIFLVICAIAIMGVVSLQIFKVAQRECVELAKVRVVKSNSDRTTSKFSDFMQCMHGENVSTESNVQFNF